MKLAFTRSTFSDIEVQVRKVSQSVGHLIILEPFLPSTPSQVFGKTIYSTNSLIRTMILFYIEQNQLKITREPLTNMLSIDQELPDVPASPREYQPDLRATSTKNLIIDPTTLEISRERKVVKQFADICKTVTKQSSLVLEDCEDKIHECRRLYYSAGTQKYRLGRQYMEEECENELIHQEILLLKERVHEVQRRWIKICEVKRRWEYTHYLNKLLTHTAWLGLEYIAGRELGEHEMTTGTKDAKVAFDRHWAKTIVMKKILLRMLNDALARIGIEEKAIVIELTTVIQSLPDQPAYRAGK